MPLRERAGRHYAIVVSYVVSESAWSVELSEAVAAPASLAEVPNAVSHLPGPAFVVATVPDEDPSAGPTVHIHSHDEFVIPYEIFRWFMEKVAEEVERCRPVALPADCNPSDRPEKR